MITHYNMDCIVAMREMPDNFFDLAIVDPPYGTIEIKNCLGKKEYKNVEPDFAYYLELFRVSKEQIIFGVNYLSNFKLNGGRIIWNKLGKNIGRRNQVPTMSDAELAYQSFNNIVKMYSYTWMGNVTGDNYQINADEFKERIHISQKPVSLYSWILQEYAKPNDKILDTHGGSFSSAIACHNMGFDLTIFELDTDYYNAGVKRLEQHQSQLTIF